MKIFEFKTSLKCSGCVEKITHDMNALEGVVKWDVDLTKPMKVLKVESLMDNDADVKRILNNIGFTCEKLT